jgi:hypothetical protein
MNNPLSMMQSFAMSMASRGLRNNKIDVQTKQLRCLSCFGDKSIGGQLEPCEHLKHSSTPAKSYCGGCGCGDRKGTWLEPESQEYSKLDYPRLNCPIKMPGFTNYEREHDNSNTRKVVIENYDPDQLVKIRVTVAEPKN